MADVAVDSCGGTKRSLILGGGARGGPMVLVLWAKLCCGSCWLCDEACGIARRSGELFPFLRLPRGTRDGIFDGDLICEAGAVVVEAGGACCLIVPDLLPVGVLAVDRGGGPFITLAGRACGADLVALGAGLEVCVEAGVLDRGGSPLGVLDRGGGALVSASSSSSRNLSP